jgi:hypothetical protein
VARGGFTAIHSGPITFGRDGRWYCDGEAIANRAICRLYARSMTIDSDGTARLQFGEDRATVRLEDTPWVVVGLDGTSEHGFQVRLNDDSTEPLDLATLRVGPDHVLYCRVKARHEARFLRPAYYALMRHVEPCEGGGLLRAGAVSVRLPAS